MRPHCQTCWHTYTVPYSPYHHHAIFLFSASFQPNALSLSLTLAMLRHGLPFCSNVYHLPLSCIVIVIKPCSSKCVHDNDCQSQHISRQRQIAFQIGHDMNSLFFRRQVVIVFVFDESFAYLPHTRVSLFNEMVSFVCDVCQETIKKPKLDQHFGRCPRAVFSCIDCCTSFKGVDYRQHNSCMTEVEKYQKPKLCARNSVSFINLFLLCDVRT